MKMLLLGKSGFVIKAFNALNDAPSDHSPGTALQGETPIEQDGATWKPTASGHDQQRPKQTQWVELYDKFITKAITLKPPVANGTTGTSDAISGAASTLIGLTSPRRTYL
ncbi:hypothetical protein EGJ52_11360 [Pseudomonas luteola]|uniref:hypothetical protein n=1 Tax=Pseudomonas luteola TaxID=47886 RepID=UPI000F78775A|nr:hypothetical protein [Pseudomonas luteola]RRW44382.1 hypothetical protein EGJ52_11360 [Pseudomonas luteola]